MKIKTIDISIVAIDSFRPLCSSSSIRSPSKTESPAVEENILSEGESKKMVSEDRHEDDQDKQLVLQTSTPLKKALQMIPEVVLRRSTRERKPSVKLEL